MICPAEVRLTEQIASAGEQLFGDEDGERRPDRPADDSDAAPAKLERVEVRMIAGPSRQTASTRLSARNRRAKSPSGSKMQTDGAGTSANPFCLRASRSNAAGEKSDFA